MMQKRLGFYWMTLSFQSGLINSAGFVLFSVYLTHMTGLFSKIGLEVEQLHFQELLFWLALPASFLLGAMLSTIWIEGEARKNDNPRYEWLFSLLSLLMGILILVVSASGLSALWLVAFCAGAQNATFNERSGAIVRTTHLTGTTTDLGISLARVFFKTLGDSKERLDFEKGLIKLRASSIVVFILGSIIGSLLAIKFKAHAFWLPCAIYVALSLDSTKVRDLLRAKKW
jgi:uncharacterized membrane protein YoaK (UPF0700 family)